MTKQSSLEDLASPLSKLRVNPLPSEFGAYDASAHAGPSGYALQDPGVVSEGRQEPTQPIPLNGPSQKTRPPGLDFNLFRSSTISTVSSNSSAYDDDRSLYSSPDSPDGYSYSRGDVEEGPSTPKAAPPAFQVLSRPPTRTPTREPQHDQGYFDLALPSSSTAKHSNGPQIQVPSPQTGGDAASVHGEQGEWGEDEAAYEWLDNDGGTRVDGNVGNSQEPGRISMLRAASGGSIRLKKKRPVVIPTRAAPPPPPEAISAPMPLGLRSRHEGGRAISSPTKPTDRQFPAAAKARSHDPLVAKRRGPPEALQLASRHAVQEGQESPTTPTFRSSTPTQRSQDANTAHQSAAWSFYDLDGNVTRSAGTPQGSELAFPRGKYTKVVPQGQAEVKAEPKSAGDYLRSGLDARSHGELARSAYFFMKAAEGGDSTGRIFWALALRHGLGVAKDEKKGFNELRRACDESLADGALDETTTLDAKERKDMNRDISFAICEVANCFLDGVGVKKSPEIAVTYLRFAAKLGDIQSQEQLGYLLTKGKGVKKDLKEAARWYRTAIAQGSPNTFGLAWIYKEKYL